MDQLDQLDQFGYLTFENIISLIRNSITEEIYTTPIDLIHLILKELDMNQNDNFIDFCAGSGAFCLDALLNVKCKNVFYNDISFGWSSLVAPLGLVFPNFRIFNTNCFKLNDKLYNKFTKIAINPSFDTINDLIEFIQLGQNLLIKNGLMSVIVPKNQISKIKPEGLRIKKIINVNNKCYNINTEFSIMIFKKCDSEIKTKI